MEVYEYVNGNKFPIGSLFVLMGATDEDKMLLFPLVADQRENVEIDQEDWEEDFAYLVTTP